MFKDIVSNDEVKDFLINELKSHKKQGTYLFYGEDREFLMEFALAFAKSLTCKNIENDFCGVCGSCKRIDARTHGDLEIYENIDENNNGIKIEEVRDLIYKASTTSYEGGNRIFILTDVEKMNREAANALLKILEEPLEEDFFILLANSLDIIPTIKSRAIILRIKARTAQELGVSESEYNFYLGNGTNILEAKKVLIDLEEPKPYKEIGTFIREYREKQDIESRTNIYKALRDFVHNRNFISEVEKMKFAEEICFNSSKDKVVVEEICNYICHLRKNSKNIGELVKTKNLLKTPINLKNFMKVFVDLI